MIGYYKESKYHRSRPVGKITSILFETRYYKEDEIKEALRSLPPKEEPTKRKGR